MRKSTFLVGRRLGRATVLVIVGAQEAPISGPWTITAVVSTN